MEVSRFKLAFIALLVCLCVSVSFNVYQYLGTEHSSKTFIFTWTQDEKEYRLELTFDTVPTLHGGNLSITAKINDPSYYYRKRFVIAFDQDGDGEFKPLDPAFEFLADNSIYYVFLNGEWSTTGPYYEEPQPSPYHTCTFDNATGYTFKINFPLEELKLKNDLIYVIYGSFWTYFHFDPEGKLFK